MKTGLLGRTLGHSYSPLIHRLFGDPSYTLYPREPEEIEQLLLHGAWDGLNVTIPYKKDAARLCQKLTPLAKELGSVNTLFKDREGRLCGHNTDWSGFLFMTRQLNTNFSGKKALVLGTGGASVTVQSVLKHLGCQVVVISRQGEHNYDNLHLHQDARFVVNATPVGMYPNNGEAPLSLGQFPSLEGVLDLIYNPVRTALCLQAEALGIPFVSGLSMLVAQAAEARKYWDGAEVSEDTCNQVCSQVRSTMENVILIGMPGSGKTTVGQLLAKKLDRPFVDTDQLLTETIGSVLLIALMVISYLGMLGVMIALLVFCYIAYYDLFRSCKPKQDVLFLVLGILVNVTLPFFVFACGNSDEGMPARRKPQPAPEILCEEEAPAPYAEPQPEEIPVVEGEIVEDPE